MAAFDFPASPTDGQIYTPAGSSVTYTYSNAAKVWKAQSAASVLSPATATKLGGIKLVATPPAGQFINNFAADGTAQYATVGNAYLGNTQTWTKAQRGDVVTTTGSFDFEASNNFYMNAGGAAATLANPTNAVTGQSGAVHIDNAASLAFGTNWKFSDGKTPSGSGAGKRDLVVYYVLGPNDIAANLIKGV